VEIVKNNILESLKEKILKKSTKEEEEKK